MVDTTVIDNWRDGSFILQPIPDKDASQPRKYLGIVHKQIPLPSQSITADNRLVLQTSYAGAVSAVMENLMIKFYGSLNERDRRRYAALEARKRGRGGLAYVSQLLGCDPKTITSANIPQIW